jgi:hypothetical protein
MLAQESIDIPDWATPLIYLLIFFVLLPLRGGMSPRKWVHEVTTWSPKTHALLWAFFLFICVLSCMGTFS